MPHHPDHPGGNANGPLSPTDQLVQVFTQKMRETYVLLGQTLIPLMEDKPEDIDTLIELGGVYEQLGCVREATATYERLRQLNPDRLPKSARAFLERHRDLIVPITDSTPPKPESNEGEHT